MYCRNARPAENMELMAIPARTIVSGVHSVILTMRSITPVATMANRKAMMVTAAVLLMSYPELLDTNTPASMKMMARDAPNAAALDRPRVNGDASGFLRMLCITAPAIPRAAPAAIAVNTYFRRRSHTTVLDHDPSGWKM